MHAVSAHGSLQIVKDIIILLLKLGADPTLTDECGYNILHHAIDNGYEGTSSLSALLSAKILPNLFSISKAHALFLADKIIFLPIQIIFLKIHYYQVTIPKKLLISLLSILFVLLVSRLIAF